MRYRVTHDTEYRYAMPVNIGHNQVFLRPRDLAGQRCTHNVIDLEPSPGIANVRTDYFGNSTMVFTVQEPHARMLVTAVSEVDVTPPQPVIPGMSRAWELVRDGLRGDVSAGGLDALQFTFDSPMVASGATRPELIEYARESFPEGRPILDGALDLTHRVYRDFEYDPTTTTVTTAVADVFAQRSGVCQDFAHLEIAMLRGLGLPARYVSGYLRTFRGDNGDPALVGADASHAWLSVYDGDRWTDFDPTNDLVPGEHHITLAWGRDYSDVCPVRGVIIGGGEHTVEVRVEVAAV